MQQRTVYLFLLFLLVFTLPAQEGYSQFWKEWFSEKPKPRARPRPRPVPTPKEEDRQPEAGPAKRSVVEYPLSKIKTRYRIDVLLPLYLAELVKGDTVLVTKDKLPEKAVAGLGFYEGVKLASDTLTNLGYNIDVYIHDVTQENLTPENLVKYRTLKGADLIIGLLPAAQLPVVAEFAKENKVNFISALSPSDANIEDNIFFTMLQPGLKTHSSFLKKTIAKKHAGRSVLLFYKDNNFLDSQAARFFRQGENYKEVTWNATPVKERIEVYLDSTVTNVVVMPVLDIVSAEGMLRYLQNEFPAYRFEVYGMPSWKFMSSIRRTDTLPNIGINFTTSFYYEPSSAAVQTVMNKYRKEFGGRPGEMVFLGYETFYWYAYLLQKYGTVFNNRQNDIEGTAFTRLDIKLQWDSEQNLLYNENEHVYLYRYQAGSYMIE